MLSLKVDMSISQNESSFANIDNTMEGILKSSDIYHGDLKCSIHQK